MIVLNQKCYFDFYTTLFAENKNCTSSIDNISRKNIENIFLDTYRGITSIVEHNEIIKLYIDELSIKGLEFDFLNCLYEEFTRKIKDTIFTDLLSVEPSYDLLKFIKTSYSVKVKDNFSFFNVLAYLADKHPEKLFIIVYNESYSGMLPLPEKLSEFENIMIFSLCNADSILCKDDNIFIFSDTITQISAGMLLQLLQGSMLLTGQSREWDNTRFLLDNFCDIIKERNKTMDDYKRYLDMRKMIASEINLRFDDKTK